MGKQKNYLEQINHEIFCMNTSIFCKIKTFLCHLNIFFHLLCRQLEIIQMSLIIHFRSQLVLFYTQDFVATLNPRIQAKDFEYYFVFNGEPDILGKP